MIYVLTEAQRLEVMDSSIAFFEEKYLEYVKFEAGQV